MNKHLTFFFLFLLNTLIVANQLEIKTIELSIDDAIQLSLNNSEDFLISEKQIEYLNQQYLEIRSQIYPQINAESSYKYNPSYSSPDLNDYENANTISGSQLLWSFGKIQSAIKGAQKAFLISKLNKESSKNDVIYSTKLAYYTAKYAGSSFLIIESSYKNVVENKKILEQRSSKGRVSKRDNIKISADIAARKPQINNAKASLKSAQNNLKNIIGSDFNSKIILTDKIDNNYYDLNYSDLELNLLENEPTLQSLKEQTFLNDEIITQRKAEFLPEISLFGNYSYNGSSDDAALNGSDLSSNSTVGLKFTVPIYNGGRLKSKLNQAKIDKSISILTLKKNKEFLILELKNSVSNYHQYLSTLKANDNAVNLAKQSYALSQELFKTGQLSVTDLNDSELQLTNQKLSKEQTIYNINITLALIDKLTKMEDSICF